MIVVGGWGGGGGVTKSLVICLLEATSLNSFDNSINRLQKPNICLKKQLSKHKPYMKCKSPLAL